GDSTELKIKFPNDYKIIATNFDVSRDGYSFRDESEKGQCYGFSATSMAYFKGYIELPGNATYTYQLSNENEEVMKNIEDYQNSFENKLNSLYLQIGLVDVEKEYNNLKKSLEKGDTAVIIFYVEGEGGKKLHAVVVYKIIEFPENNPKKAYLLVYDGNFPYTYTSLFGNAFRCLIYDFVEKKVNYDNNPPSKFVALSLQKTTFGEFLKKAKEVGINIVEIIVSIIEYRVTGRITPPIILPNGIFIIPFGSPNNSSLIEILCPVNATITDQYDRVIANNGTNQIPNAEMYKYHEEILFVLPATLTYSAEISAYDKGSFTLSVATPIEDGNSYEFVAFENIPISSSTKASITLQPDTRLGSMSIDYDGNGVVDGLEAPDSGLTHRPFITKSEGGTLTLQDGTRIVIPQNALTEDAEVMLSSAISDEKMALIQNANDKIGPFIAPLQSIKAVREIVVRNISDGSMTTSLNGNLTLFIPYPDANNDGYIDGTEIKEGCLGIFTLNEERKEWKMVSNSQVDTLANLVYVQVNHLSIFSLMANVITSITHNATSTLGVGEMLTVAMQGQAGGTATFTIAGMATTTMTEVSSGAYQGTYTVQKGDYIIDGIVTGWLQLGTEAYRMDATTTVTLKGVRDNLTNAFTYPNPCRVYKGQKKITFSQMTDQATIQIFNVAGELIATLEEPAGDGDGKYEWEVPEKLASGVYIYLITNNQNQKPGIGKIGIVR
ncbi:T9SS type A sorting domain-containing protein, partial [bacterium]|nr:T9SS type A sorting domain-containing protein [bacterium]MBU1599270.1 T9SS type A sorting domain-containing protein [bacterium]